MKVSDMHKNCCSADEIGAAAVPAKQHEEIHSDDDGHNHGAAEPSGWLSHWPLLTALLIVVIMMVLEYGFDTTFHTAIQLIIFIPAYLLAGYNVLNMAFRKAIRFDFFNEFFLMSVATIGAFA